jgi:hypothetical protein
MSASLIRRKRADITLGPPWHRSWFRRRTSESYGLWNKRTRLMSSTATNRCTRLYGATVRVVNRHGGSRPIDEQLFADLVFLAQHHTLLRRQRWYSSQKRELEPSLSGLSQLRHCDAAVDPQFCSGGELRLVRSNIEGGRRNLFGLSGSAERYVCCHPGQARQPFGV